MLIATAADADTAFAAARDDLLVGADTIDDAAVYRLTDDLACVLTTDFFTPIVDDPYDFGRIAAANAFSDIYAMGAEPRICLNLMAFPRMLGLDVAAAVLRGSGEIAARAGALVAGGHTIEDAEPKYGMCVLGVVSPDRLVTNGGAVAGDVLFLTKPLGTGIMTTALKCELLDAAGIAPVVDLMATLNAAAGAVVRKHALDGAVHACTDVTGFGIAGHTHEMCMASNDRSAVLDFDALPLIEGALGFAAQDVCPGKTRDIRAWAEAFTEVVPAGGEDAHADLPTDTVWTILADPQTSGGLLIAVDPDDADAFEADLRAEGAPAAARIGHIVSGSGAILVRM